VVTHAAPLRQLRWTVDRYHEAIEAGVITAEDRVELIGGQLIEMPPISDSHFLALQALHGFFARLGRHEAMQQPVVIPEFAEPQPDLYVLRPDFPFEHKPSAEDLLLAIEVSDTTLDFDREEKVPRYLNAGCPEVWVVNLPERQLEVYRHGVDTSFAQLGVPGTVVRPRLVDVSVDLGVLTMLALRRNPQR
jgi:Uma2 family endonuclease